ncbi:hypothetical protein IEQ34_011839 [Dendrobium chrysotoxum]|uniref:Uncharacterized protein n=1 Tax=Dendrobium chrysotoxum TaxID=161865 RepID=A0AAV7GSF1_DENCH|nr:hypothetical protein IEQ34_011839 [Dendrobium chrysotoxum]
MPAWSIDLDLHGFELDPEDLHPSIPLKKVPAGDVFEAARAGDVDRLRCLLDSGVNVNARDRWDSVALYYACLAGHVEAARMLLEAGAICSEHTFDGDRCHYAALNLRVRRLLKAFEARPPPLAPLPAALRDTFLSCPANRVAYLEQCDDFTAAALRAAGQMLNYRCGLGFVFVWCYELKWDYFLKTDDHNKLCLLIVQKNHIVQADMCVFVLIVQIVLDLSSPERALRGRGRAWERESCEGEFVRCSQRLLQAKIRIVVYSRHPSSLGALKEGLSARRSRFSACFRRKRNELRIRSLLTTADKLDF